MEFIPIIAVVLFFAVAFVLGERSLRRQVGSGIKRSREEELALGHAQSSAARGAGGQGIG